MEWSTNENNHKYCVLEQDGYLIVVFENAANIVVVNQSIDELIVYGKGWREELKLYKEDMYKYNSIYGSTWYGKETISTHNNIHVEDMGSPFIFVYKYDPTLENPYEEAYDDDNDDTDDNDPF